MKKIKMLHLVQGLQVGGAEVLLLHYIKALPKNRYDHYVYYFGVDGPIRERLENLNVTIRKGIELTSIKNPFSLMLRLLFLINDLLHFISTNKIQVIQSHLQRPNQLAVLIGRLSKIPAFPTVHNTMAFIDRRPKWDLRVYIMKFLDEIVYRLADKTIAISDEVKEIIKRKYKLKENKIVVLKNGIAFKDTNDNYELLEKEFNVEKNIKKILFVGRLTYQKAVEVLLKAANDILNQGIEDFKIIIVGDGEEKNKLLKMIRDKNLIHNVVLAGIRSDVISLMNWSDMFIIPSRYEGLSIAMIEAMACGLPIIASNAPGIKKYIEHYYNGMLFPIEDHKTLSKYILRVSKDKELSNKLSTGAINTFERNYNIYENIKSIDRLILNRTSS